MSDAETQPASLEDIGAGLVNGAMAALLGAAVAGFIGWQIVAELTGWLPDLQALSAGLPPTDFDTLPAGEQRALLWNGLAGSSLILTGFWAIRWGVGHIRQNLRQLRARRR